MGGGPDIYPRNSNLVDRRVDSQKVLREFRSKHFVVGMINWDMASSQDCGALKARALLLGHGLGLVQQKAIRQSSWENCFTTRSLRKLSSELNLISFPWLLTYLDSN